MDEDVVMILCNFHPKRVCILNFYSRTYSALALVTIILYYSVGYSVRVVFGTEDGYNRITGFAHVTYTDYGL